MLSIVRRLPLLSLILVLAGPAQSLDFSNDLVLYEEDFEGETSFPTTPEVDLIAAGGMDGVLIPSFGSPTLSGTAISASVGSLVGDTIAITGPGLSSIGTDSFNLRGEFSGLSATTDADFFLGVEASFDSGEVDLGNAGVVLLVDNFSNFEAQLGVFERDGSLPGEFNNYLEVPVPSGASTALLAGAAFVLDFQIDRAAETVTASVDIDGFSPIIVGPMSLTVLSQTDPMTGPQQDILILAGTLVEVEFDSFRISQTQAAAMVPSLSPVSLALLAAALLGAAWHRSHNRSYDTHGSTTSSA
jgi:hypothetical protein